MWQFQFWLLRNLSILFHTACTFCIPRNRTPVSLQITSIVPKIHTDRCEILSYVVWICISLVINVLDLFFIFIWCFMSLKKNKVLGPLFIDLLGLFTLELFEFLVCVTQLQNQDTASGRATLGVFLFYCLGCKETFLLWCDPVCLFFVLFSVFLVP